MSVFIKLKKLDIQALAINSSDLGQFTNVPIS